MAIFPFILLREKSLKENTVLINHERIHLRQQAELLIIPFYVWYITEYLIRLIIFHDAKRAYRSISFEREAYNNDTNLKYIYTRPFWNFAKFITLKK